jgi:hypothetical protein
LADYAANAYTTIREARPVISFFEPDFPLEQKAPALTLIPILVRHVQLLLSKPGCSTERKSGEHGGE